MSEDIYSRRKELEKRFPFWQRLTLGDRFDMLVEEFSDNEFIYTADKSYSYREVQNITNQLAKGLLELGIKPREHVAVAIANYPEFIFLTFALAKIGAVKIPLPYRQSSDELAYVLRQSDAVCLIAMGDNTSFNKLNKIIPDLLSEVLEGKVSAQFPKLRKIISLTKSGCDGIKGALDFQEVMTNGYKMQDAILERVQALVKYPDDVVDIFYTSGTTGQPKGAMLTHDMLWRSAYGSCLNRAFEKGRRIFIPIPFFHVYGYVEGILAASLVGGTIIPQVKFELLEALQLMSEGKANDILCVPAIAFKLINCPDINSYDLSTLRAMYCSATPAPLWFWKKLKEVFNIPEIITGYGMTEVCGASAQTVPGDPVEIIATRVGRLLPGGCSGLPEFEFRNTQYKVIDPLTGEALSPGAEGELVCRGNIVTKGYYKKPIETYEAIDKDGWMRTGDLGIIHDDGYIELTGRCKDIYKIAGENVVPKEVEKVIEQHPKVLRAFVIGVPDLTMGEVGAAFIEIKPGELITKEEVIHYCSQMLAPFKVPKYVRFMKEEEFPMTENLKIQKFNLKEMAIREFRL